MRSPRQTSRIPAVSGFTLIELAVAITLLGILIAAGLPSFMTWIRNSQVRTVAEALQTGVRQAQTDAVRLNQPVVFSLTNVQPAKNATAVTNGKNWSIQSIAQFEDHPADFLGGGALAEVASNIAVNGDAAICFNSNGRLVANATTGVPGATCTAGVKQFDIQKSDYDQAKGDRRLSVRVAIGGQVRMCDPDRPTLSATAPDGCPP